MGDSMASKWIKGADPKQPVSAFARRALKKRLRSVWHFAALAAKKPEDDIEHVHQLRVATRRAGAGLQVFADLLPARRMRWMKKQLRTLRRAAGDARDLDVLAQRLGLLRDETSGSELEPVHKQIVLERRKVQKPLRRAYRKAKCKRFPRRSRKLLRQIRWRGAGEEPSLREAAGNALRPLVDAFFAAADQDLTAPESLHEMRIQGKRIRYALELLVGAFDTSFRKELYPVFEEVQDKLGATNDHASAEARFRQWHNRTDSVAAQAELAALAAAEGREFAAKSTAFRAWWTKQRATDLRRQFDAFLENDSPVAIRLDERHGDRSAAASGGCVETCDDGRDNSKPDDSLARA